MQESFLGPALPLTPTKPKPSPSPIGDVSDGHSDAYCSEESRVPSPDPDRPGTQGQQSSLGGKDDQFEGEQVDFYSPDQEHNPEGDRENGGDGADDSEERDQFVLSEDQNLDKNMEVVTPKGNSDELDLGDPGVDRENSRKGEG